MKIRIEAKPGEFETRHEDVIKVIKKLAGYKEQDMLEKAMTPKKFAEQYEFKAIASSVKRARKKHVLRLQNLMNQKIAEVLKGS